MTMHDALLRTVIESPGDDLPRLVMADFLEESGEVDRSSFIRVQCELARSARPCPQGLANKEVGYPRPHSCWMCSGNGGIIYDCDNPAELRRRERELHPQGSIADMLFADSLGIDIGRSSSPSPPAARWEYHRGFVSSLTCDWQTFRRVADALIWTPGEMECPRCRGRGGWNDMYPEECARCDATGRIQRPFPPTAQPITKVTLTSPFAGNGGENWEVDWFRVPDENGEGVRFDRVKCPTCDGTGLNRLRTPSTNANWNQDCPDCHGTPPNTWHCDRWPGIVFVMPEAKQRDAYGRYRQADFGPILMQPRGFLHGPV